MTIYETLLFQERRWYSDPNAVSVWVHLLMIARAKNTYVISVLLNELSKDCGLGYGTVWRKVKLLEDFGVITVASTKGNGTVITICGLSGAGDRNKTAEDRSGVIQAAERLYRLYPAKTQSGERGVRSTGKCAKDKQRLMTLLKTHTEEQIERAITNYVTEQHGEYLKNFSTFLNNLPESEDDSILETEQITGQDW